MSAKIVLVRMFSPHAGDRSCDIEKQKYYLVSFQFDHFKSGSICLMHLGVWLGIEYLKNIFEMGIIPVKSSIFQFFKYLKKKWWYSKRWKYWFSRENFISSEMAYSTIKITKCIYGLAYIRQLTSGEARWASFMRSWRKTEYCTNIDMATIDPGTKWPLLNVLAHNTETARSWCKHIPI